MDNPLADLISPPSSLLAEPQDYLCRAFAQACESMYHGAAASRSELAALQRAATAFGAQSHDFGDPPERMLVSLKRCLRESQTRRLPVDALRALEATVVRWGIEAYYHAT